MSKKYEILDQVEANGLYRIRALRDIPMHCVKAGDLGGLISEPYCLYQKGDEPWKTK